ncbi:MAG TPA: hypothetical protein VJ398_01835 [Acidimicrobiia bacterium]|nr:hypothetical protein [Acidimicrobiia bacterium]
MAGVVLSPGPEHPPEESGETVNARADVRPVPDGPARWPVLVAVAVVVASVAGFCAGLWLELQSGHREEFGDQIALGVAFLAFAAVGAAIFARRPGHRIGWLFSVIGVYALVANHVRGRTARGHVGDPV